MQQSDEGRERLFLDVLTPLLTRPLNIAMQLQATKSCVPRSPYEETGDLKICISGGWKGGCED
jgi:hypothetical protein